MKRDELVAGVLLFLFGALTAYLSANMKIGTVNQIGTGFFPLAMGILLMILSSLYLAQAVARLRQVGREEPVPGALPVPAAAHSTTGFLPEISQPTLNVVGFIGAMIFFALFLPTLGYLVCVSLMLLVLLRVLGMKSWFVISAIAFISAIGSWLLFAKLLTIPLPRGLIWF